MSLNISFPDGSVKDFPQNVTGIEIAKSISISLAKKAIAIKIEEELRDLSAIIEKDCSISIITSDSKEGVEIIRHSTAHLMAEAVKELYPDTQITIGPIIENGFYYDFAREDSFALSDLSKIENKMREIAKRDKPINRKILLKKDAINFFRKIGEEYKVQIIEAIKEDNVTIYEQGNFSDLCRGPHVPSTKYIKYFKLTKLAGAYWRGDSNNEMLQRIYGTSWGNQDSLDSYMNMIKEAEKRDHRKIGKELDLFHMQEEAVGSVFWHHKGWIIHLEIEKYIREKLNKNGYIEVKTPQLIDKILWEKSGHWEKFRENMFICNSEEKTLAIKPMNCPGHIQIFNQKLKSYRQLPLRMAEFGSCHRNEPSGSLHGIMRVRNFTQDDAHIFCEESQITEETIKFSNLLNEVYKDFGFDKVKIKFSDRPEKRSGTEEIWDKSEASLKEAVEKTGLEYSLNPGEGAFYGPKLEFILTDAIGRDWQCGTLQVDFILPEKLDASFVASDGSKKRPVILHRAILGSLERFIGILIENYAGNLPFWLSPVQVAVIPVTNNFDDYATKVAKKLEDANFRIECDLRSEKINYKIRELSLKKIPYILILGEREKENNLIAVREFGTKDQYEMSLEEFIKDRLVPNKKL